MSRLQRILLFLFLGLIAAGTGGYVVIEGWSVIDSWYMTVITLSTVGYGEVAELSAAGRIFTCSLITFSVILMACCTAEFTSVLVSGQINGSFRTKKERRMISQMTDHTVVCGGGVTALTIIRKLAGQGVAVVAVTKEPEEIRTIRRFAPSVPIVEDDPKSELAMLDANLLNARNLVAASGSDFDNLLVTITGRGIGSKLHVVSFAHDSELASRMAKVGANEVICPQVLGGEHVAHLLQSNAAPQEICDTGPQSNDWLHPVNP